jgi:hypothetical protein
MTPAGTYYDPAKYPAGTSVRVKSRVELEAFLREWKYHNPLQPDQLECAGQVAAVAKSGMYHGGDVLYELSGIPGIWHERCLEAVSATHAV